MPSAVWSGHTINAESIRELRLSLVQIVEDLLVAEGSALQVTTEYLNGQEVLFTDTFDALAKQLQLAEELIDGFNSLARLVRVPLTQEAKFHSDRCLP